MAILFGLPPAGCGPRPNPSPPPGKGVLRATARKPDVIPTAAGKVKRERLVEVTTAPIAPPHNQVIELPLFDDTVVQAVGIRTEAAGRGFVWIGQLRDQPTSQVILSVQGASLAGNVLSARGNYEIRPAGNGVHVVRELDPATFKEDDVNRGAGKQEPPEEAPNPNLDPCGGTDTGESIDVLIAYTATARANNGGTPGIEALIYGAVAATNQSYLNSGVTQRLRIVRLQEEAYTESGDSCTDLVRLRNASDGPLDGMLTARDTFGADLVVLVVDGALVSTSSSSGAGGGCTNGATGVFGEVFGILNPNTTAFETRALAVVQISAATTNLTFAHETGHLMGARHERLGNPTNNAPFDDNHGFFNTACGERSVMARIAACPSCTRMPFWSNPATLRCGAAFGIGSPAANAADNHRALNASAATVANFRCSSPGRTDVWMRDTWDDTGAQPDPRTAGQAMWQSPYIWVRTSQDADRIHQHEHQTPALDSDAWSYVKLHNGGGATSGTLELYWAHSSTGLAWPATWTLAGTVPVTTFAAASTQIVEIPWHTPASAPSTEGHFCLLARWVSASDPIAGEGPDIGSNVRNSNNLVWRNLRAAAARRGRQHGRGVRGPHVAGRGGAAWEPGDEPCGTPWRPWPWPGPGPGWRLMQDGPRPHPWLALLESVLEAVREQVSAPVPVLGSRMLEAAGLLSAYSVAAKVTDAKIRTTVTQSIGAGSVRQHRAPGPRGLIRPRSSLEAMIRPDWPDHGQVISDGVRWWCRRLRRAAPRG